MKNAQLLIKKYLFFFILLVFLLSGCSSTTTTLITTNEYDALYTKIREDNELYLIEQLYDNYYYFYIKINGEKSNAYYITEKKRNNYYILEDHTKNYEEKTILPTNYEYFETKGYLDFCENNTVNDVSYYKYYIVDGDYFLPLCYLCVHYTNDSKNKYTEFIVNLSTGEEMPYEKYGIID